MVIALVSNSSRLCVSMAPFQVSVITHVRKIEGIQVSIG